MYYTCYQLKFKAESPIFVGSTKIGIIQQTKRYIPGKTLWGAITANVTRELIDAGVKYSSVLYGDIGKCIEDCVKTTYFYPTTDSNDVLIPRFTENGLKYGQKSKNELSENAFEFTFIKSFVSTATVGDRGAAKDESLHETEYIVNKIKSGDRCEQVYWTGYMFIRSCENDRYTLNNHVDFGKIGLECGKHSVKLIDALKQLYVGGDSRYGFGKLSLLPPKNNKSKPVFNFDINLSSLKFDINSNKPIFAHLKLNNIDKKAYLGDIEPFVGRMYDKNGFGRYLKSHGIVFMPGTCFTDDIPDIEIKPFGLLEKYGAKDS